MLISQKCCNLSCAVSYNKALHKKTPVLTRYGSGLAFPAPVLSATHPKTPAAWADSRQPSRDVTALGCQNPSSFPKTQTYATEGDT